MVSYRLTTEEQNRENEPCDILLAIHGEQIQVALGGRGQHTWYTRPGTRELLAGSFTTCRHEPVKAFHRPTLLPTLLPHGTLIPHRPDPTRVLLYSKTLVCQRTSQVDAFTDPEPAPTWHPGLTPTWSQPNLSPPKLTPGAKLAAGSKHPLIPLDSYPPKSGFPQQRPCKNGNSEPLQYASV